MTTAGTQTVTATDTEYQPLAPAPSGHVTGPGPSSLSSRRRPPWRRAVAFSVTVSAEDQYGNPVTNYTGTVSFSGGGSGATLPGTYTFVSGDNGSHTFSGVSCPAPPARPRAPTKPITATDSGNPVSGSATVDDYAVSQFQQR